MKTVYQVLLLIAQFTIFNSQSLSQKNNKKTNQKIFIRHKPIKNIFKPTAIKKRNEYTVKGLMKIQESSLKKKRIGVRPMVGESILWVVPVAFLNSISIYSLSLLNRELIKMQESFIQEKNGSA